MAEDPPHHLPPFRPRPPGAGAVVTLTDQERIWLNDAIAVLAEIRLDLQTRKEYLIRHTIQLQEQDRRLELVYTRLASLLREKDG